VVAFVSKQPLCSHTLSQRKEIHKWDLLNMSIVYPRQQCDSNKNKCRFFAEVTWFLDVSPERKKKLKERVQLKRNSVIIYSHSCCSKPVWFSAEHRRKYKMFCLYNESTVLFCTPLTFKISVFVLQKECHIDWKDMWVSKWW